MTSVSIPSDLAVSPAHHMQGSWQAQHIAAANTPKRGAEAAIALMVAGLTEYARAHAERFESPIGDDGVLGDHWEDVARGILGLLNGDCGRFDCGSVDSHIRHLAESNGLPELMRG